MSVLARWCARQRFLVLALWVVVLGGLGVAALTAGSAFTSPTQAPTTESTQAYALLAQMGSGSTSGSTSGQVVWRSDGIGVDDPTVVAQVQPVLDQIAALDGVASVVGPYDQAGAAQLSTSADTAFASVTFTPDADRETVSTQITSLADTLDATDDLQAAAWGASFKAPFTAPPVELIGVAAALIILMLVFRTPWAAALPIVTGVAGVGTSILTIMLASHAIDIPSTATSMGALIGLGVGIDYALFIVNRHRKALLRGRPVADAITESVDSSGRAVVFAGGTVVIALLGLLLLRIGVLSGMAVAAAATVLLTVISAITLLPALLAILGPRVLSRRQRRQLAAGVVERHGAGNRFARWAGTVERRPALIAVAAAVVMLTLAAPALSIRLGSADDTSEPATSQAYRHHELMAGAFGDGFDAPLLLVAQTPDDAARQAFTALTSDVQGLDGVAAAYAVPGDDQPVSLLTVTPASSAASKATSDLVTTLRHDVIPQASAGSDLKVYVGGTTASNVDFAQMLTSKLPLYLLVIAALGFLLLAMAFRSVLVPLMGALSNLLTMAVSLGAVTAAFGYGWLTGLLGLGSGAPIEPSTPIIVVGIVFGLSMDYQVFLVSRIREEWTRTGDNHRAVRVGMAETGGVIAAAASIMFCVFAAFGMMPLRIITELGVGLAVAILADAFVVRLGLVPAVMHLLGRRNWWYPRWAQRITPHLSIEGGSATADDEAELADEHVAVSPH